jgi:general secretion pathway protein F
MPVYEYKGLSRAGKNVRGTVDADNVRQARLRLKKDGVFVVDITDKSKAKTTKVRKGSVSNQKVPVKDLAMMTRQLATLLKANIPLVESLGATADQVDHPVLKEALQDCRNMVNEGATFHKSLSKYPKVFNNIYRTMVEAGEMSGTLDVILIRLAEFTEAQNELNAKVKSAMLYPVIMLIFMLLLLAIMFIFVIPKVTTIFDDMGKELPWYTEMVIGFSGFLVHYGLFVLIGLVLGAIFFFNWKDSESGKPIWDRFVLSLPIVGKLSRIVAVSRFTRTLSTLLQGGVPMLNAMDIVRNVVNNTVLARAIDDARENISEGESVAVPLRRSGQFPPIVTHMISIGEKTGELEEMLLQVSDSYDFQVKNQVGGLTSVLEPLLIIVMGGVIAMIAFSLLIPMLDMASFAV